MITKLNYNVHQAINFRSHRVGLVNNLLFPMKQTQFHAQGTLNLWLNCNAINCPCSPYPLYFKHYSKH